MKTDTRVDDYIAKAAPFAQPILRHLRQVAHDALPQGAEAIKWGMPHFCVNGKNVAGMAAFKAHCSFTIHGEAKQGEGMGQCGKIASLSDLPADAELVARLQDIAAVIETGGSATGGGKKRAPVKESAVPEDLAERLGKNAAAKATFDGFTAAQRRDYVDWITGAKREATRASRLDQAVEWLAEGKKRYWKYENC